MNRHGFSPRLVFLARSSLFAAALAGLSGCPQGAELEDPDRFLIGNETTGGSNGTGGAAAGTGSGGGLNIPGVTCDWQTGLAKSCGISACHGRITAYADLLLTVDDGLFGRLKDVPGTIGDVDCDPGSAFVPCTTPPAECTHLVGLKLVDSDVPDNSLILKKLQDSGCGNTMPIDPGNSPAVGWDAARLDCLQQMVRGLAAMP